MDRPRPANQADRIAATIRQVAKAESGNPARTWAGPKRPARSPHLAPFRPILMPYESNT